MEKDNRNNDIGYLFADEEAKSMIGTAFFCAVGGTICGAISIWAIYKLSTFIIHLF
jgi:hypothetical protein